ncbi:MAG: GFA family protein [Gammaproteobacteria bacterium]
MSRLAGGCMCGRIRYDSQAEPMMTAVCHCPDCQRQTGTAFSIVVGLPADALEVEGEMAVYSTTGVSGAEVHRHFCPACGSPIFSQPDAMPGLVFLKAGTLDDRDWLEPGLEMFCDTAQPWVRLDGDRERVAQNPPLS